MALEALTSAAPVRGREYLVVSPAESIEQFDYEASIQALTDALTNKSIFVVTVHLDYSNTQGGKRDADITLRFDGIDQNGKEYTIAELSRDTLKKSFNAELIEYTNPITGLSDWNRAINEIGRYGVKLQDVPVRFQYTDEEPEPRYAIHRAVTHIDPSAVRSKSIGRQLEQMMQYEHSPIIIDIPEKPDATEFIVHFGDGQGALLNKFALANAFGFKNEKIFHTDAAWLSRKLSHCRYNGHIRTVLVRQNGQLLNPYIVKDNRTDETDELVDAWFAIKNEEKMVQQRLADGYEGDAVEQLTSVYANTSQSTEDLLVQQDEIEAEIDWDYLNPESTDPEIEDNKYDRSHKSYARKFKTDRHTGVWEDQTDKQSPIAIKRWEKRNLSTKTKPIFSSDHGKKIKIGEQHLNREKRHYRAEELSNKYGRRQGRWIDEDGESNLDYRGIKKQGRNDTVEQLFKRRKFKNTHALHKNISSGNMFMLSKIDRKIERWEEKIRLSKQKELQKNIDQKIRESIARDAQKARLHRANLPKSDSRRNDTYQSSAPILSGRKKFAVGYGSRGGQPEPGRFR